MGKTPRRTAPAPFEAGTREPPNRAQPPAYHPSVAPVGRPPPVGPGGAQQPLQREQPGRREVAVAQRVGLARPPYAGTTHRYPRMCRLLPQRSCEHQQEKRARRRLIPLPLSSRPDHERGSRLQSRHGPRPAGSASTIEALPTVMPVMNSGSFSSVRCAWRRSKAACTCRRALLANQSSTRCRSHSVAGRVLR